MSIKNIFSAKGAIEKAVDVIDKVVPDTKQKTELKFEIYKIIASSAVAKYVRALLALMFFVVWLFFPEKLEGREKQAEYMLYAVAAYYFLVDKAFDKSFSKIKK